jgi:predicted nucleotidyltransferase
VTERVPLSLLAALADLVKWLEAAQIPAVIIGGVASSLLGRPRMTQDIDALAILPESDWGAAIATAQNFGIAPRIGQAVEFARRSRVLLLKHEGSEIDVDVILGGLPFEQDAVERAQPHKVGGISVRLPRVEDLMVMKVIAHRAKDLQDVEGLLDAHPGANIEEVRQHVSEFASAASMPDLLDDLVRILQRRRGKRPGPEPRPE